MQIWLGPAGRALRSPDLLAILKGSRALQQKEVSDLDLECSRQTPNMRYHVDEEKWRKEKEKWKGAGAKIWKKTTSAMSHSILV